MQGLTVMHVVYLLTSSQACGFLRFLSMLSCFDWQASPLVVDLNDSMKGIYYMVILYVNTVRPTLITIPLWFFLHHNDLQSSSLPLKD